MRINKFIANNSQYSRRHVDALILEGKVFLNDEKIKSLGQIIDPQKDIIKIAGQIIKAETFKVYLLLNKPAGYLTSRKTQKEAKDIPTVMDLLPAEFQNLKPVGRLDLDTEGLLIMTNDGEYIHKLTHPSFEHKKTYHVEIDKELSEEDQKSLEKGIFIENQKTAPAVIKILKKSAKKTTLTITIHEGRNRQIRKMFGKKGHKVQYLKRIKSGKIDLGNLKKGQYRKLTIKEINAN